MGDTRNDDQETAIRVRRRLDEDRQTRGMVACDITVIAGRTLLTGHARSRRVARGAVSAAQGVRGVSAVEESLVADDELELRVATAINGSPLNRRSRLVVRSALGHVGIGGTYVSNEAWAEAVRVGAATAGVIDATAAHASDVSS